MRYFYLLFLCFAITAKAQSFLTFDTRLIDSEDKWVSFPMNKDSVYVYGFVYLDEMAGLTFNLGGTFSISKEGEIKSKKQLITDIVNKRLTPTNLKVAIIPDSLYKEFDITPTPFWPRNYRAADDNVHRLFRLGYTHNAWNEPEKALPYLEKVKRIDTKYPGLHLEIAFSYNALKQYDKANNILEIALKDNPNECGLRKELVYTLMKLEQIDKAIESLKLALDICKDKKVRSEMLRNIVYHYFSKKDKEQFKIWADKAKEELSGSPQVLQVLSKWEAELNQ